MTTTTQHTGEDWSFLDSAIDWEDLLQQVEPGLSDDSLLDSEYNWPKQAASQQAQCIMLDQLLAQPQPQQLPQLSDAAFPGVPTGAACTQVPASKSAWLSGGLDASSGELSDRTAVAGGSPLGGTEAGSASTPSAPPQPAAEALMPQNRRGSGNNSSAQTTAAPPAAVTGRRGSGQTGRGGGRAQDAAAARTRERSRQAQRRYQERQRAQLARNDAQAASLQEQLRQLQLDKEALSQRNVLLERVAALAQQQQRAAAASGRHSEIGGGASGSDSDGSWLQDRKLQAYFEQALQLSGRMVFTVHPDAPLYLTQAQIGVMPLQQFRDLGQAYVNAFAVCLMEIVDERIGSSAARERLARLVVESARLKAALMTTVPKVASLLQGLVASHAQRPGAITEQRPSTSEWDQIAAGLKLSEEQVSALLGQRELYLRAVGALAARRRSLAATLQAAMPPGGSPEALPSETLVSEYDAATLGAFAGLQEALRQEHTVLMLFAHTVYCRVLAPEQFAHLAVSIYPLKPHATRLAEAVARAVGGVPAADLLKQGPACDPERHSTFVDAALPVGMRPWRAPPTDLAALYPASGAASTSTAQVVAVAAAKAQPA